MITTYVPFGLLSPSAFLRALALWPTRIFMKPAHIPKWGGEHGAALSLSGCHQGIIKLQTSRASRRRNSASSSALSVPVIRFSYFSMSLKASKVRRPPNEMGTAMFLQLNGLNVLITGVSRIQCQVCLSLLDHVISHVSTLGSGKALPRFSSPLLDLTLSRVESTTTVQVSTPVGILAQ